MDCISLCSGMLGLAVLFFFKKLMKKQKIDSIHERRVFITGCDTGFGRSLALRLDNLGVPVYAGCISEVSLEELKVSCSEHLKAVLIDVRDSKSIKRAADLVKTDLNGRALWAIVNNAGILGSRVPFEWTNREHCREILEVNLLGMYDVTLAFLPLMKTGGQGRIVNMSSANGRFAISAHGYSISKFGVEGFSDGLSYDVEPYNISVHVIEPGLFKTPMVNIRNEHTKIRDDFFNMNNTIRQDYGEDYLKKYLKYVSIMFERGASSDIYKVIEAYEHAILGKYPQNRYTVGKDSSYIAGPISYLPLSVQMMAFRLVERLMGTKLPIPEIAQKR